jgi:hypothetical protein
MWSSLKRHWNHQWVDWIQLGGQYLSATKELTNTIEKQNLQSIATQAGLYFHQGDWVSKFDFQTIHHLEEIDGQVSKTIQNKLKKLLLIDIERLLTLAKKTNTSSQVKPGTSRKVVRALLGNPGNVTWVEWQNHMLEQWDYSEQSVRIVDGRVCEVVSKNNNATR